MRSLFRSGSRSPLLAVLPMMLMGFAASAGRAEAQGAPAANFQGAYVGAHLGGGKGGGSRLKTSGAVGGLQGGYNYQSGQIVLGGEADASLSGYEGQDLGRRYRQGTTATGRARVGAVLDRVLVYGTGGIALQGNSYRDGAVESARSHVGAVYGAGAEVLMTQNVSVRAEYLRYDFGKKNYNTPTGPVNISPDINVFRGGLNYKF